MKKKNNETTILILVIGYALLFLAGLVIMDLLHRKELKEARITQIDSTKVVYIYDTINVGKILYEDTWGKIILVREE